MQVIRSFGLAAIMGLSIVLVGCVSTPLYKQQTNTYGAGYGEQRLDESHYRVTFAGKRSTARADVENALMLRAAEVTQAAGYTHFIIDRRETEQELTEPVFMHDSWYYPFYGYGYCGPLSPFAYRDPFYPRSGWHDPLWDPFFRHSQANLDTRFTAYADIALLKGPVAAGTPQAMDAAQIITTLGPRFRQPAQ